MAKSAKRLKSDSKHPNKPAKRKVPHSAWKPGVSGNPAGRPKDGESWAGVISKVANMTTDEILAFVGETSKLGRMIARLSKNVQVKYVVTARVMAELMTNPSAGLWNGLMDRMDGKVALPIKNMGELPLLVFGSTDEEKRPSTAAGTPPLRTVQDADKTER